MQPTPRAHKLYMSAQKIMNIIKCDIKTNEKFSSSKYNGVFTFSMIDSAEPWVLKAVIGALNVMAPGARVFSVARRYSEVEASLSQGEIDVAIGYFPDLASGNIMSTKIGEFTFTTFVRSGHPLAEKSITIQQYNATKQVTVAAEIRTQELFYKFLLKNKMQPKTVIQTNHFLSVADIVQNTDLMATVPTGTDNSWPFPGEARRVYLPVQMPVGDLRLYWHKTVQNDPRHKWLRKVCVDTLRFRSA